MVSWFSLSLNCWKWRISWNVSFSGLWLKGFEGFYDMKFEVCLNHVLQEFEILQDFVIEKHFKWNGMISYVNVVSPFLMFIYKHDSTDGLPSEHLYSLSFIADSYSIWAACFV